VKTRSEKSWLPWVLSPALVALALVGAEGLLRLTGAGFEPRFFLGAADGYRQANRHFGRLFFPERLVREGVAVRLADPKPDGAFRIFVLGESAAMGFPVPHFGFPRLLDILARESFPACRVEVANVAMAGISSHGVRRIALEVLRLEPDALVIYMGNNEVVGPFGPGTAFGTTTTSLWQARAAMAIRSLRLGQWLDAWLDRQAGRDQLRWGGMGMFVDRRVPQDHPALTVVYDNFRRNLEDILRAAARAGVPVVLCTVAVNTNDFAPLAGDEARELFARATAARQAGDEASARELFARARDLDELRFRADGRINAIIRETARTAPGEVTLLDLENDWAEADHAPLFWEHVHLTFAGNGQVARAVWEVLVRKMADHCGQPRSAAPDDQRLAQAAGHHAGEEAFAATEILRLLREEPFRSQPGNAERVRRWSEVAAGGERTAAEAQAWAEAMAREVERFPDDPWQRVALAQAWQAAGQPDRALVEKRVVGKFFTHDLNTQMNLAHAELAAGNPDAARAAYQRCLELHPLDSKAHIGLAACAMREDRSEEAIHILQDFAKVEPLDPEVWVCLAQIYRFQGRARQARRHAERALQLEPGHQGALFEMEELSRVGR
jgi:Flp pilus assembly protein TadD/lysophospholipase L1-like esterase